MNPVAGAAGPREREAVLAQAKALRGEGRIAEALAVLDRLEALDPGFSRLHQERGQCHIVGRDAPAAVEALREAVRLNPTLPASWDMLEQLHRMLGDPEAAAVAGGHRDNLRRLPPEVVMANSLFVDGDLEPAEEIIRVYLDRDPANVGALHLFARIRQARGDAAEAEALLAAVVERAPDYRGARLDYARALLDVEKPLAARRQAEAALALSSDDRDALAELAVACVALDDNAAALAAYDRLLAGPLESGAELADLRLRRADILKTLGRGDEAIADYRASLAARPDYGVAWFSLANLKTHRFSDDDIDRMRAAESWSAADDMDRVYLCFALGKALEDTGEFEESWRFYERGNALRRLTARYRPEAAEACVRRTREALTAEVFADRAGWGAPDRAPIFVVGLPRSGSTLVEQILASHSRVEGTHELTELGRLAAEVCGRDPDCGLPVQPAALARLGHKEARALGERYLAETRAYRRLGRPLFVDKMPNNFWHVGLIQLILPGATIIDVRRRPMACCFSNLKQLFGGAHQEFAYGVEDVARHYRAYVELMRHWDEALPGRVLRVRYEDLVDDLEGQVRRLLDRCGLPFEPGCVAFHQTRRSIRTPSAEQVRQPLGREGIDQWRLYERQLGPLRAALGEAADGEEV